MAAGRPSDYTQDLADRICAELAQGKSLRTVCASDEMPALQTIFNWFKSKEGFVGQYARAKEEAADAYVEEMQDLADNVQVDKDAINKARLQIDTRKWVSSKLKPKKYGEKLDMTTNGKDLPTPLLNAIRNNDSDTQSIPAEEKD